jgi:diguanylate cyclase (GGDEF)-like protein
MSKKTSIINKIRRTILIVDDEMINQEILKEILSDKYDIVTAENGEDGLKVLKTSLTPISLILLDINMPIMGGLEFISIIKEEEQFRRIPIIVCTSQKESEIESLELGAVDFIKKPYDMPEIILARTNRAIELSEDQLIIQATERDALTGTYNKHIFMEYVHVIDEYNSSSQYDMLVLNIDKFHIYNEIFGKDKGDKALVSLTEILMKFARLNDGIVGRLHDDYFVLYVKRQSNYGRFLEWIDKQLEFHYSITNLLLRMGVYQITAGEDETVDDRIGRAEQECKDVVVGRESAFRIYDVKKHEQELLMVQLTNDLENAIQEGQFEVYYQPKINVSDCKPRLSSAEALIRWNHPKLGFISPGLFIPLFESNGSIRLLDEFVWRKAANQVRLWKEKYNRTIPVSVNVSRADIFDKKIVETFDSIISETGINQENLQIEITESAYNNETDQMIQVIDQLRSRGFKILIDDFGKGYSSLYSLASFSFDVLKLDIQFVREMFKGEKNRKIVDIIAEIGEALNVPLVAEGVETAEQLEALKQSGYNIIQGFYFSKPLCERDFDSFIEKGDY